MGNGPSRSALIAARRLRVEQLLLRGLTQREICTALKRQNFINPRRGTPWSLGTINRDIQHLEDEWEDKALEARAKKKARVAAEIDELKRAAWRDHDLRLVSQLLQQERQLFGLDEPLQVGVDVEHSIAETDAELAAVAELEEDELDMLITNLMIAPADEAAIEGEYEEVNDKKNGQRKR